MEHENVASRLPWLVNGTLSGEEREQVVDHLRDCGRCRGELAETLEALELFDAHPGSRALVDAAFADDAAIPGPIADHLAGCATCRDELALLRADEALVGLPVPRSRARHRLALLAAAATVVVAFAGWILTGLQLEEARDHLAATGTSTTELAQARQAQSELAARADTLAATVEELSTSISQLTTPRLNPPVLELLPRSLVTRSADDLPTLGAVEGPWATLLLAAAEPRSAADRELRVSAADGSTIWSQRGLVLSDHADYTVQLPLAILPRGEIRLEVRGLVDGSWELLDEYRFKVTTGSG